MSKKKQQSPIETGHVRLIDRDIAVDYASVDDIEGAAGDALWSEQRVRVVTGLERPTEQHTVIHELLHIVSDVMGINLKEDQIQGLAFGLVRLIADNPQLVAYLTKKEESAA